MGCEVVEGLSSFLLSCLSLFVFCVLLHLFFFLCLLCSDSMVWFCSCMVFFVRLLGRIAVNLSGFGKFFVCGV